MRCYLDTEFNGMGGALISLALVSEDDVTRGIYLYTDCAKPRPWVRENVPPVISAEGDPREVGKEGFGKPLTAFLAGDASPVIVCNWPDNIRHFCQVMKQWPDMIFDHPIVTFELVRVSGGHEHVAGAIEHNAWWDAVALREVVKSRPQRVSRDDDQGIAGQRS